MFGDATESIIINNFSGPFQTPDRHPPDSVHPAGFHHPPALSAEAVWDILGLSDIHSAPCDFLGGHLGCGDGRYASAL